MKILFDMIFYIALAGGFGYFLRSLHPNPNVLRFRRILQFGIVVSLFYILWVFAHLPEDDPQSLITNGADLSWISPMAVFLSVYFGAWAFIGGLEKRVHHIFIFFDPSFYSEIKKPAKKKK